MSWLERAQAQLEQHSTALKIIEGIGHLVREALVKPDSEAHAILEAIDHAVDAVIKGFDGEISREEAEKVIEGLASRRAARNAASHKALDDKFDHGGKT